MPVLRDSKSNIATDPLRNFKFLVRIHHSIGGAPSFLQLGFMSVSGLNVSTEVIPYREGGNNTTTRKMPGQSNFSDITLTNGVLLNGHQQWYWFRQIFFVNQGRGLASPGQDFRVPVDIHVLDHPANVNNIANTPTKMLFQVYKAWPSGLAYSDLDAGGNAILVQQMTLAHEGWDIHWAKGTGAESVENRRRSG